MALDGGQSDPHHIAVQKSDARSQDAGHERQPLTHGRRAGGHAARSLSGATLAKGEAIIDHDRLTITQIERRTGVAASTLRIWELRHGFPSPVRLASGHRRYSDQDAEAIRRVVELRSAGLSLARAIEQAGPVRAAPEPSVYGVLRRRRPDLATHLLSERSLLRVTRAIEDECLLPEREHLLLGAFQSEGSYRRSQPRWQKMAGSARLAVALVAEADTRSGAESDEMSPNGPRRPAETAASLRVDSRAWDPSRRQWLVLGSADSNQVCLAAWERPGDATATDGRRLFEVLWTVDGAAVAEAARTLATRLEQSHPTAARTALELVAHAVAATPEQELARISALTSRMLTYLSDVPGGD